MSAHSTSSTTANFDVLSMATNQSTKCDYDRGVLHRQTCCLTVREMDLGTVSPVRRSTVDSRFCHLATVFVLML
jgi:hypothetical protein